MNSISKKLFAAAAGLMIMMGAECSEEHEFTCEEVSGVGYHKVKVMKCKGSEVEILNGKLYVKKKGECKEEIQEYWGTYAYNRYTGKSGRSFNVPLGDLVKLGAAAAGVSTGSVFPD